MSVVLAGSSSCGIHSPQSGAGIQLYSRTRSVTHRLIVMLASDVAMTFINVWGMSALVHRVPTSLGAVLRHSWLQ